VRMRRACDWLVDRFARGKLDAEVRATLRLGAYQLAFLHTPAHAAVSGNGGRGQRTGPGSGQRVLRRVAETVAGDAVAQPGHRVELPGLDRRPAGPDIGEGAALDALAQMNKARRPRCAPMATSRIGPANWWRRMWVRARASGCSICVRRRAAKPTANGRGRGVRGGGRHRTPPLPDRSGQRRRLEQVSVAVVAADGANPPWRDEAFDRVLVDAPARGSACCAAVPMPVGRGRRRLDAPGGLQRRLLEAAAPLVRPGGTLVYSVCTLSRVETAAIDRWPALTARCLRDGPRCLRRARRGGRRGVALCSFHSRRGPTGCSCWRCGGAGRGR